MAVATFIGIVVALVLPPAFRSEARIMPEMNVGGNTVLKRLSSVAGFADLDLSEADDMDAIRPDLYPSVLQSTPFILYLLQQPVVSEAGQRQTVAQFLEAHRQPWWEVRWWPAATRNKQTSVQLAGTIRLSEQQQALVDEVSKRVQARLDTRSGVITITATMPSAELAAAVAQLAMKYLTTYVTDYRTEKARQDLRFYQQQLTEAKQRYHTAQLSLFRYGDNHKHVVMLATTLERHRLEAELTIAQSVYAEVAQRYEQAKLKVQERTPIYKVLEPPKVPLKRESPRRTLVVLGFMLAGVAGWGSYAIAKRSSVMEQVRTILATG